MTHDQYLEAHHELTTKVLPEIAMRNGREDYTSSAELLTQLRAKLDSLWTEYVASVAPGVRP